MSIGISEAADQRILAATRAYVAEHPDSKLDGFREPVVNWGNDWVGIPPAYHLVSDLLRQSIPFAEPGTREYDLMTVYAEERETRFWEQSYTAADDVGEDMLTNYGYTEIIGKRGPFISNRVRAGVGIFGAGVNYPAHRHVAEEIYIILAGSATFHLGNDPPIEHTAGDVVHLKSRLVHGFRIGDRPLVVFYLWQGGDLREKSTFV